MNGWFYFHLCASAVTRTHQLAACFLLYQLIKFFAGASEKQDTARDKMQRTSRGGGHARGITVRQGGQGLAEDIDARIARGRTRERRASAFLPAHFSRDIGSHVGEGCRL